MFNNTVQVMNTTSFLLSFFFYWLLLCACYVLVVKKEQRGALAAIIPALFAYVLAVEFTQLEAWQRLWLGTIGLLFTIKTSILLLRPYEDLRSFSKIGLFIYMSIWPGMDPKPFAERVQCLEDGRRFVRGYITFWLGIVCFIAFSDWAILPVARNWLCLAGLFLIIHFGYADMLSCALRCAGWDVRPLFDAPFLSSNLRDFWSKRWNIAFVEMDRILFLPLTRRFFKAEGAILLVFVISGLLHEIGISYASGRLWGLPLIYFLIQGTGMIVERRLFDGKGLRLAATRTFTFALILLPLPLLFNNAFMDAFVAPLSQLVASSIKNLSPSSLLAQALWLAALGHFCTLMAGLQVPFRLHWPEELSRLGRFSRKIMLYCAACVGLMIVAFGTLTIILHDQMLAGDRAAVFLALFIALFWIARLAVDCFYFHDSDWPKGPEFVIGHALLNSLFIFLAAVYSWVLLSHWPMILNKSPDTLVAIQSEKDLLLSVPLSHAFGHWADALTLRCLLSQALWLAAIGNFSILLAAAQVPFRLHWKEELRKLSNFNRKIFINYWAYVFMIVAAFGWLTLMLHDQLLIGEKSAVALALLFALFWLVRLMADRFYFSHADWPQGPQYAIAHALVTAVFLFLAAVYSAIVILNWLAPHFLLGKL
jgi:alginate O-acetyltransferase complex protein AlgI